MANFFILLTFSLVGFSYSEIKNDGILRVPLKRQYSPSLIMAARGIHPRMVENTTKLDSNHINYRTVPVPLLKYLNSEIYGQVQIGSKAGKVFNVIFDTVWSNSWVPSVDCSIWQLSCLYRTKYNGVSTGGIKTNQTFTFKYADGNLAGDVWKDTFRLNNLTIKNQVFGAARKIPKNFFFMKADGIVGLGFNVNTFPKSLPFFYNMINQNLVNYPIFSIYINRTATSQAGTLLLGGTDDKYYTGNFTTVNVDKSDGFWAFQITKISGKNKVLACKNGCMGILDSSTTAITGPPAEIDAINKYIGAHEFHFGLYKSSCELQNLPAINITFGGRDFTLEPRDYVQKFSIAWINGCFTAFRKPEKGTEQVWMIGGAFISKYYVAFDVETQQIGFAQAV